jgi:hypothetical protein
VQRSRWSLVLVRARRAHPTKWDSKADIGNGNTYSGLSQNVFKVSPRKSPLRWMHLMRCPRCESCGCKEAGGCLSVPRISGTVLK